MKVPWLSKKKITLKAQGVIAEYEKNTGVNVEPPVPVEDIIERGLYLKRGCIEFENKMIDMEVLGATYVKQRLLCVNKKLLQNKYIGRLNFTWAHEVGHWLLHRKLVGPTSHLDSAGGEILCRTVDRKKTIEWQADYFAACLLMPDTFVQNAYQEVFGPRPLQIYNVDSRFMGPLYFAPCIKNWHCIADSVRKAGGFSNVSKQAMIIRLQDLGWVVNETNVCMDWDYTRLPN